VWVAGQVVGQIGQGMVILVGVTHGDTEAEARKLASKVWHLRIFEDSAGDMNLSLGEVGGSALVISQFTLYGDTSRGRRPSWTQAAPAYQAEPLVGAVVGFLSELGAPVETGRFGADMQLELQNDGPVTLVVDV
jgi:D-tyrosyl-tRNA(Tyr) deacylase